MIREAMEKVQEMAKNEEPLVVSAEGREFLRTGYKEIEEERKYYCEDALETSTLHSITDYIKNEIDDTADGMDREYVIHIESPTSVKLFSGLTEKMKRNLLVASKARVDSFDYGRYMQTDDFVIDIMCYFKATADSEAVLSIASNLVEEEKIETADDGFSQRAVVKTGIVNLDKVEIQNPLWLTPYRTFSEIEQPSSPFVFRIKKNAGCALFTTKSKKWEQDAMINIEQYFCKFLKEHEGACKISIIM